MSSPPPSSRPALRSVLSGGSSPQHVHQDTTDARSLAPSQTSTAVDHASAAAGGGAHIHFPQGLAPDGKEAAAGSSGGGKSGFKRTRTMSSDLGKGFKPKVGFDTFDDTSDDALFSFTLQAQSEDYTRTRETRVFLIAVSPDESGAEALDWAMENIVEDGDEVVALRVVELDEDERASAKEQEKFRDDARELQRLIMEKNAAEDEDRKISVVVEFVAGKKTDSIMRLIALYRPDSLIVGTRGSRGKLALWGAALGAPGMGSVSRYCISHSAVPVIVVRPEAKVKKSQAKREKKDPKRKSYLALLGTNGTSGTNLSRSRSAGGLS